MGIAAVALASACGGTGGGKFAALKALQANCPNGKFAQLVELDANITQRGEQMTTARLAVVKIVAMRTAACKGHLRVVAFGPTASANVVLFDGDLVPGGATANAQVWRITPLADHAVSEVQKQMDARLSTLSSEGEDPLGALEGAAQYRLEVGDSVLHILFETSGIATNGTHINPETLTPETADALAASVNVPEVSGAQLTWAGLGRVGAGPPPSTSFVTALRSFYGEVCKRTKAASCIAVSDVAPGSGS